MTPALKKRREVSRSIPLWEKEAQGASRKQKSRVSSRIWYAFLAILVIVIAIVSFRVFASFSWNEGERLNVVVAREGSAVALISVPRDGEVHVFYFDPQVTIGSAYGYGEYKVGSLLKLGNLEGLGSKLLIQSLELTLGMKIHGYVPHEVPSSGEIDLSYLKKLVRPLGLSLVGSPIGIPDLYYYIVAVSQLRSDQVNTLAIHESRLSYTKKLPDDSSVYVLDTDRLDAYLRDSLASVLFSQEEVGVAIINTTSHSGLATLFSRALLNTGIDVVSVGESQDNVDITQVIVSPQYQSSLALDFIEDFAGVESIEGNAEDYRAGIVVKLGQDFYQRISEKPHR